MHGAHHADDFPRELPTFASAPDEVRADRILVRPEASRQLLVDDEDGPGLLGIARTRKAPAPERNAHGLEVVTSDDAGPGARPLSALRCRMTLDLEEGRGSGLGQGQVVGDAGGAHSGQALDPLDQLAGEDADPIIGLVPGGRERRAHGEDLIRAEPGIHAAELPEAATEKTGAREEDQSERDLPDDEGAFQAR